MILWIKNTVWGKNFLKLIDTGLKKMNIPADPQTREVQYL
jgi:hypothetical protein